LNPGYTLWVSGEEKDGVIQATNIVTRPTGQRPDGVSELRVLRVKGADIETERAGGDKVFVRTTADTVFENLETSPRPAEGSWLNIGFLFNPYRGLLKNWVGYHGVQRGVARMDWGVSWKLANGSR